MRALFRPQPSAAPTPPAAAGPVRLSALPPQVYRLFTVAGSSVGSSLANGNHVSEFRALQPLTFNALESENNFEVGHTVEVLDANNAVLASGTWALAPNPQQPNRRVVQLNQTVQLPTNAIFKARITQGMVWVDVNRTVGFERAGIRFLSNPNMFLPTFNFFSGTYLPKGVAGPVDPEDLPGGALLTLGGNLVIPNAADTALAWSEAAYDDQEFWSPAAPTRLTVPEGVSRVGLSGAVSFDGASATGYRSALIKKNGQRFAGGREGLQGNGLFLTQASTAMVPVQPGDFFELFAYQNSGSALATDNTTYPMHFSIQIER
ncbi:hypothetical protein [Deinococcus multiflagellatus]|uniref:hypothetical protein n=1 Tax=Deinococcus multiflagellatus TaxID=1656887 RepID=UPI001CCE442B|nr:hypothetical protein [Deinococcus multiflagellatus]MBZ9713738.1 hypothetical protein [Deinococcus multiflagellatus]